MRIRTNLDSLLNLFCIILLLYFENILKLILKSIFNVQHIRLSENSTENLVSPRLFHLDDCMVGPRGPKPIKTRGSDML